MKDKVIQWLADGCNFTAGLMLLSTSSKHRQLLKVITNHPERYARKLQYELCKLANLPFNAGQADSFNSGQADVMQYHEENVPEICPTTDNKSLSLEGIQHNLKLKQVNHEFIEKGVRGSSKGLEPGYSGSKKISQGTSGIFQDTQSKYPNQCREITKEEKEGIASLVPGVISVQDLNRLPSDVQVVIREHSKLYLLRSQLHEQMANLPEDNTPATVKKRKNLSDSIALLSPRIDQLFFAKEDYYKKGLIPDLSTLFPPAPISSRATDEKPLPDSAKELKKLKKNLQSANVKDQNIILYQQESKADKPSPMPSGPKRLKLEKRIKEREQQIDSINYKLLSLEDNAC